LQLKRKKLPKEKGKKLFGGIVANTDEHNYRRRWVYFEKPSKDFRDNSFDNWSDLVLL
jgi:hypothetical protein